MSTSGADLPDAVLAAASDAVVAIDEHGRIVEWNEASSTLLGWSREEALGALLAELIVPPELREAHLRGLARVRAGAPSRLTGRILPLLALHRDGSRVPVEMVLDTHDTADGPRFHALLRDASPRLERDLRLREAEARFARYASLLPGAVIELRGRQGRYRCGYLSDGWRRHLDPPGIDPAGPLPDPRHDVAHLMAVLGPPAEGGSLLGLLASAERDMRGLDLTLHLDGDPARPARLTAAPRRRDGEVVWEALVVRLDAGAAGPAPDADGR